MGRGWGLVLLLCALPVAAQDKADLGSEQERVARRYKDWENNLKQAADLLQRNDPDRAAVLGKASSKSRADLVVMQLEKLTRELREFKERQLIDQTVLDRQQAVIKDMGTLLDLLLSEDRARQVKERRERIEKYLAEVQNLKKEQRDLRARTERQADGDRAAAAKNADRQGDLAQRTERLAQQISKEDAAANNNDHAGKSESDGKPGSNEKGGKPAEAGQAGKDSQGGKPSNSNGKPGQPAAPPPPGNQKPESPSSNQGNEATPGQQNLQNAKQAMESAKQQLQELKRQKASAQQEEAIKELEKAIEQLEEILRQLREEEREQMLASLEARFRKMLALQREILDRTVRLDKVPVDKRTRADEHQALALSRDEGTILADAEQALLVLREDGTAVAFPEAVQQVRDDVEQVVRLLGRADTGEYTQGMEKDIITSLEEMIASLQRQLKEMKEGKPCECNGKSPLVDRLAELKMIFSMEKRVQERTHRIAKLYDGVHPPNDDIRKAVDELAERQNRVYEITRAIALGKNQ